MKFIQFWSSPQIWQTIPMNKFLSGEFHVFSWKNDHYWLWALPWKFGGKIKFDRMKFILFVVMGIDWVASMLGEMVRNLCHILQSFRVG